MKLKRLVAFLLVMTMTAGALPCKHKTPILRRLSEPDQHDLVTNGPRNLHAELVHDEQQPLHAEPEADRRHFGTAEFLDQTVVATAAAQRSLRAWHAGDDLEHRLGIVIEPSDATHEELLFADEAR